MDAKWRQMLTWSLARWAEKTRDPTEPVSLNKLFIIIP